MKKTYHYKGQTVTSSSRKEAIEYFAKNAKKITSSVEIDDDLYEKYGEEFLSDEGYDGHIFDMSELDEQLQGRSPSEAIMDAYCGHDYTGEYNNHESNFNPNEDYFSFDSQGNLVSIRSVYKTEWLKDNIDSERFEEWLKENEKDEYMDILRDKVEAELNNSPKTLHGFEFKKLGYDEVIFDRDDDTLGCFDCYIDYDYDSSLDGNLEALHEEIMSEHPDADDDEDED